MNKTTYYLTMALEALQETAENLGRNPEEWAVIIDIKEALAEEQEPVAWHEIVLNQKQFLDKMEWLLAKTAAPPQPEQEPVEKYSDIVSDGGLDPRNKFDIPPQRTWVGLFDDEIMQIWGGIIKYAPSEVRIKYFARAIESKLKEVNT